MPVATSLQLGQLQISPDIVRCPLIDKIAPIENHFEMQFLCWKNYKRQDQETKSPLYNFGQVTFNLGFGFLKKKGVMLDLFIFFSYPFIYSFIPSFTQYIFCKPLLCAGDITVTKKREVCPLNAHIRVAGGKQ